MMYVTLYITYQLIRNNITTICGSETGPSVCVLFLRNTLNAGFLFVIEYFYTAYLSSSRVSVCVVCPVQQRHGRSDSNL